MNLHNIIEILYASRFVDGKRSLSWEEVADAYYAGPYSRSPRGLLRQHPPADRSAVRVWLEQAVAEGLAVKKGGKYALPGKRDKAKRFRVLKSFGRLTDLPEGLPVECVGFLDARDLCMAAAACRGVRDAVFGARHVWRRLALAAFPILRMLDASTPPRFDWRRAWLSQEHKLRTPEPYPTRPPAPPASAYVFAYELWDRRPDEPDDDDETQLQLLGVGAMTLHAGDRRPPADARPDRASCELRAADVAPEARAVLRGEATTEYCPYLRAMVFRRGDASGRSFTLYEGEWQLDDEDTEWSDPYFLRVRSGVDVVPQDVDVGVVVDGPEPVGRYAYAEGSGLRVQFTWAETDESTDDDRSSDSAPPTITREHALPDRELLQLLEGHFDFE